MVSHHLRAKSPYLIVGLGVSLFLIAVVHHATELYTHDGLIGPLVALVLDGLPALGLVYAGYWLAGPELSAEGRWQSCVWCLVGACLFVTIMGLSLLVRAFEGRIVGEAVLPLLIATEVGGIAGVIAGYYTARARAEARRAQTATDALDFVNTLIRHDLRNDLNVIQGYADLLEPDPASAATEPAAENASIIVEKAEEALARIETTGAVAQTLTGDPDLERVDLAAITAEMATRVQHAHDLSVTADLPDHATVIANAGLRSVVDNVLENAVEHNDADDPQVHVEVETTTETVQLTVADNGPGIPDEQKERLRASWRWEASSGGLSLVQTLVDGYEGEVRIEDNDPCGAVVTVELPRAEPEQQ